MDFKVFGIKKGMSAGEIVEAVFGTIAGWCVGWFLCAALLMWGWGVVAPHLNAPLFSYWECFAIYCGLRVIGKALFKKS